MPNHCMCKTFQHHKSLSYNSLLQEKKQNKTTIDNLNFVTYSKCRDGNPGFPSPVDVHWKDINFQYFPVDFRAGKSHSNPSTRYNWRLLLAFRGRFGQDADVTQGDMLRCGRRPGDLVTVYFRSKNHRGGQKTSPIWFPCIILKY